MSIEVQNLPREQMIKAQTLGAFDLAGGDPGGASADHARLIKFGAADAGTGVPVSDLGGGDRRRCRTWLSHLLVRRYLSMDVILPYVAWITLLAFALDLLLGCSPARLPWAYVEEPR